jgi:hypothetical protein
MKKLSAITMFVAFLFALPALADTITFSWEVASGNDQYGNPSPLGAVAVCVVDTERLGLSALDSISPNATLTLGGGLLQTDGQTNGYIVNVDPAGYVANYPGMFDGGFNLPISPTYQSGQPTTIHAGDPVYIFWFPTLIDYSAYQGNGLDAWSNIIGTLGPLGAKAPYGIFGYNDETTDNAPGGSPPWYEGTSPGWVLSAGGWSGTVYADNQYYGGCYPDNDPNLNATYQTPIPGDANGDGKVDINDLTIVLAHYGQTGMSWSQGEFTGDGTVDINDLTIVLANYGTSAGASGGVKAVPEPCTPALLVAGLVCLLACAWRRRK